MRSTDEHMAEVLGRARANEAQIRRRRQRAIALGGGVLSVFAVVLVGVGLSSSVSGSVDTATLAGQLGLMGSVHAHGSAFGYVVVGLLGLVLGATVTSIAFKLGRSAVKVGPLSYRFERSEESPRSGCPGKIGHGDSSSSAQDGKETSQGDEARP